MKFVPDSEVSSSLLLKLNIFIALASIPSTFLLSKVILDGYRWTVMPIFETRDVTFWQVYFLVQFVGWLRTSIEKTIDKMENRSAHKTATILFTNIFFATVVWLTLYIGHKFFL